MVEGDKKPIYEETLEDVRRFNENPALPFNAFGTLALARAEFDANSGSSQVFFLLKVFLTQCNSLRLYCLMSVTSDTVSDCADSCTAAAVHRDLLPVLSSSARQLLLICNRHAHLSVTLLLSPHACHASVIRISVLVTVSLLITADLLHCEISLTCMSSTALMTCEACTSDVMLEDHHRCYVA